MTIKYLKDIDGKILKKGDEIIFNIKEKTYNYIVVYNYLSEKITHHNNIIFNELNLNGKDFCEKTYGYRPTIGDWPESKQKDFKALTRCVIALYEIIENKKSKNHKHKVFNI